MTNEELKFLYELAGINEQTIKDLRGICGLNVDEELIQVILSTIEDKLRAYNA
jgi:hypothetical protein